MKVLIIGTGYVGTTTALLFCEMGHDVTGLDLDESKLSMLKSGKLPFYEPGIEDLLKKHLNNGTITFTNNVQTAVKENDVIYICVGTPESKDGSADLSYVKSVAESIGRYINRYKLIVTKSTVPVGTAKQVTQWILASQIKSIPFEVASNPEFLREGSALQDALHPDRVILGTSSHKATLLLKELYKNLTCPLIETSPSAAEMIKYAANSFLALKISYINELGRLCDKLGIDINEVSKGMGLDHRIGNSFLEAGIGYGGSCFPKDVNALIQIANTYQSDLSILNTATQVNQTQPLYFFEKIKENTGDLNHKKVAVLGLSFKPHTDDVRETRSLFIIDYLKKAGAQVHTHDPIVNISLESTVQNATIEETVRDAEAVIICTDWPQYKEADWNDLKDMMKQAVIFDGRNMLDRDKMRSMGYKYYGVGR
ncbi:nucleotide sugar dehydrogenase [Pontibacillus chungwhensis BH030062]|uniref:UDP-glucose 6-dehydrogenase n=1 Tax=Pontibacillus chungwhensis BH030062 TaxID=1385513 RepID=A0A0A2VBP9_9BACI|nr:UDP-glucose/GDP-mannose dehydrogenase family protein [Pontibacillus chungwhensis]KGP91100.1 nucleotide sugar dehydrogenase [Pontibacillus chungwhensis BH030062]